MTTGTILENYHRIGVSNDCAMFALHVLNIQAKMGREAVIPAHVIAKRMSVTPTTIRKYIREMEAEGLLVRRPGYCGINYHDLESFVARIAACVNTEEGTESEKKAK